MCNGLGKTFQNLFSLSIVILAITACSESELGASKFQSSLSCGMSQPEVINLAIQKGGVFRSGESEIDFNVVSFGKDQAFYLIIKENEGLVYGRSINEARNLGNEFLCCEGMPNCETNETTT